MAKGNANPLLVIIFIGVLCYRAGRKAERDETRTEQPAPPEDPIIQSGEYDVPEE